ncbi:hypothetical protein FACS1894181_15100 [Bacteroidia bacterium]|nr:hypothetical protein FACS1894181_15100 [Bacteroidia bacterium]
MKKHLFFVLLAAVALAACTESPQQEIYRKRKGESSAWVSFENRSGAKGAAARENKGAKGHPANRLAAGDSCELLRMQGPGIINRIWMTVSDRSPETLRALWIKMYWDDAAVPAVSAPLGDFFCNGLSIMSPFENCFFSNPEGRSMNTVVPMPFRTAARIVLFNLSGKDVTHVFYDMDLTQLKKWEKDMCYFHCHWNRENPSALGKDYTILPETKGEGRFLGVSLGVRADSIYKNTWWGEGEVKFYLDGDSDLPSLCGTGTEDYIGTGWGQGRYCNRYQGCLVADSKERRWSFYRFHVPDPVLFSQSCKVTLQQIGGSDYETVRDLYNAQVPLIPITADLSAEGKFFLLMDTPIDLNDPDFPKGWVNFYRQDDISSVAYFYLDKPYIN